MGGSVLLFTIYHRYAIIAIMQFIGRNTFTCKNDLYCAKIYVVKENQGS